jgi:hypothetical protein
MVENESTSVAWITIRSYRPSSCTDGGNRFGRSAEGWISTATKVGEFGEDGLLSIENETELGTRCMIEEGVTGVEESGVTTVSAFIRGNSIFSRAADRAVYMAPTR